MIKSIVIFIVFLWSQVALAQCESTGCGNVAIERLYVNTSGIIYIGTSGDEELLGCDAESNRYVTLDINDTGGNAVYSTLLAAQTSNKNVSIRTQNGSQGCKVLYVTLDK